MSEVVTRQELMKTAARQLRQLAEEVQRLREKTAQAEYSRNLVQRMVKSGTLPEEDVLEKLSEFEEKSQGELEIIEKAIEMSKSGNLNLGSLSEKTASNTGLDPLTNYLMNGEDE